MECVSLETPLEDGEDFRDGDADADVSHDDEITIPSRYFLLFLAWEIQRLRRAGRCWRNIRHGSGVTSSPMMDEDAALIFVWGRYRRKLKISSYYTDVCVSFY